MKYAIIYLSLGSTIPSILNQIITHPAIVDVFLGILAGLLFGMLCVMVFVGPTPEPQHETEQRKAAKTKRQPRKIVEQASQIQHGLNMFNYQPTEWGIA